MTGAVFLIKRRLQRVALSAHRRTKKACTVFEPDTESAKTLVLKVRETHC